MKNVSMGFSSPVCVGVKTRLSKPTLLEHLRARSITTLQTPVRSRHHMAVPGSIMEASSVTNVACSLHSCDLLGQVFCPNDVSVTDL